MIGQPSNQPLSPAELLMVCHMMMSGFGTTLCIKHFLQLLGTEIQPLIASLSNKVIVAVVPLLWVHRIQEVAHVRWTFLRSKVFTLGLPSSDDWDSLTENLV
jgi:hypothetical protein